ncbi:MAG: creatininase family protein [Xanthobacteraceae bacterium]|nr:creatininase family protein [Xanthobacteraceae bacterium]
MTAPAAGRAIGYLTFQEIGTALRASSILCLPMGSMEQHGPHLPLNTDSVLAEAFTGRIVERWGEAYDLWRLPPVLVGLSREHEWAAGTLSLSVGGMTAVLRDLAREIARALPARNLLIVNGHGGNRGILEALSRELRGDFGLNLCALHLGAMMSPAAGAGVPEIHAGQDETSVMLALAPDLVRRERIGDLKAPPDGDAVRAAVLDPAANWPWSSGDPRLADQGVIGDAAAASAEHGKAIVSRVVEAAGAVLKQLRENQTAP